MLTLPQLWALGVVDRMRGADLNTLRANGVRRDLIRRLEEHELVFIQSADRVYVTDHGNKVLAEPNNEVHYDTTAGRYVRTNRPATNTKVVANKHD